MGYARYMQTFDAPVIPDRETVKNALRKFAVHWRERIDNWTAKEMTHIEKSYGQQFWSSFLKCFGISAERFDIFEQDADRATTGNRGYIDCFWPSVFIGEAKSPGEDLQKAYYQALDYLNGGSIKATEFPRYVLIVDFETFQLTRLGSSEVRHHITFPLADLADHVDELQFLAGIDSITKVEEEIASIDASKLMARMYTAMLSEDADEEVGDGAPIDPEEEDEAVQNVSIWLTRLLFLLFGDDAGLWETDLFYRFVSYEMTPANLGPQLRTLFDVLNTPENKRSRHTPDLISRFPYVNGSLFSYPLPPEFFTSDMREALLEACRFRWTRISPAVFGAMFQLVKSKQARRAAGEHYTSETNILKVIEPLFLNDLRNEAKRLLNNKTTTRKELIEFQNSLASMTFLDPACGCGNFLVVAYRELRNIETSIIERVREKDKQNTGSLDVTLDQKLSIGQFHGFELNWWPAKIAETAMFLVDHQANHQLAVRVGQAPQRLPIKITAHITHGDALEMDWSNAVAKYEQLQTTKTYVFGNPPFLGHYTRTKMQKSQLQKAWGGSKVLSKLDYVTAWHAKALEFMACRRGEWAYVTTNSVAQGDQTARLFRPIFDAGWRIKFAHSTFSWNSEAPGQAVVHCIIVGFTRDSEVRQRLWEYDSPTSSPHEVSLSHGVNAYLIDGPDVLVDKASKPLSREVAHAAFGSMPRDGGHLLVEPEDYAEIMSDPVAAKYVRPFVGARQLLHSEPRWCLWLQDLDPSDYRRSRLLQSRVEAVEEFRAKSSAASTRDYGMPHLFVQIASQNEPYVCVPRHFSASRRWVSVASFEPNVIAGDSNFIIVDRDGLQFALISSGMYIAWQRAVGGRIKSDLRFASTLTWFTFPVPDLDDKVRTSLIEAGRAILEVRKRHPERSLADHYGPIMDKDLIAAHNDLDRIMDRAMGAHRRLTSDSQRLRCLFSSYAAMIGQKSR